MTLPVPLPSDDLWRFLAFAGIAMLFLCWPIYRTYSEVTRSRIETDAEIRNIQDTQRQDEDLVRRLKNRIEFSERANAAFQEQATTPEAATVLPTAELFERIERIQSRIGRLPALDEKRQSLVSERRSAIRQMAFFGVFALGFGGFGFFRWVRQQRELDRVRQVEFRIRQLELQKLEHESKQWTTPSADAPAKAAAPK